MAIPQLEVDHIAQETLSPFSGEFTDPESEKGFLAATWDDYKKGPRNAMLFGGVVFIVFSLVDLHSSLGNKQLLSIFISRGSTSLFILGSAFYIHRARAIFSHFHLLMLVNQLIVAVALIYVGEIRQLPFIHNAFHVFMVTLIYYQFIHNRFAYTLLACGFFPAAYLIVSLNQHHIEPVNIIRFCLYLTLANGLGLPMLRAYNKNRRKEYVQYLKEQRANRCLQSTVKQLLKAQQEVKSLQGILPICSVCKKIRDDHGYWNQLETYIQEHSQAEFSHSLCLECAKKQYPEINL